MKFHLKTVVLPLIIATILIFILQIVLGNWFTESFMLISADISTRPWILLTSMFLHGSASHLFFNMYGLFLFGPLLEHRIGAKKFLFIYLLSGIIAASASAPFYEAALGASGALMGMLGTLIILMPNLRLLLFFAIPTPLWVAGIIWVAIDLFGVFMPSGVANIAHLVGMGSGLLYGIYLKKQRKTHEARFEHKTHMDDEDIDEYLRKGKI